MRKEFLFETFEIIDVRYIEEAESYRRLNPATKRKGFILAVASVIIVSGIAVVVLKKYPKQKIIECPPSNYSLTTDNDYEESDHEGRLIEGTAESEDMNECGGEGTIATNGVCISLSGTDYWLSNEEGYAFLQENYIGIKNSLVASGVNAENMIICKNGYGHLQTDSNTVAVNWRDYLIYNDGVLISIVTVSKDADGLWYGIAFGGTWYAQYNEFLEQHRGEELVYLYIGSTEAIVTPNNKIYRLLDFSEVEGLSDSFDYYSFYNQTSNTYTPD